MLLAVAMSVIIAPLVPPPAVTAFSMLGVIVTVQQIIIGLAIGFAILGYFRTARVWR